MALTLPRTNFNSSRLVRFLGDLDIADIPESKQSFAERLSLWLDVTDAIALSAALKPRAAGELVSPSGMGSAVHEEFARVRAALVDSIGSDDLQNAGNARIRFPLPTAGASNDSAADFSPYHRYYLAHQREMDTRIGPLRTNVRAALVGRSPAISQLAALDAVMEEAFRARERNLLSTVPLLLEKRFEHLRRAHQASLVETQLPDDTQLWIRPGGWLAVFCKDMQNALLAELELRLQPIAGLLDALGNEVTRHQ